MKRWSRGGTSSTRCAASTLSTLSNMTTVLRILVAEFFRPTICRLKQCTYLENYRRSLPLMPCLQFNATFPLFVHTKIV